MLLPILLSLALPGSPSDAPGDVPGDVLVILLDDVGKDLLAVYGGPEPAHTPNIDLLAANGRVYDRAYANPICAPSRSCLVTGRYGFRTGFGENPTQADAFALLASEACVPELLPATQVSVQVFSKWHLVRSDGVPATDRHPFDACGFERFFGHVANIDKERTMSGSDHYLWRRVETTSAGTGIVIHNGYAANDFSQAHWATSVCKEELVLRLNELDLAQRAVFLWSPTAPHHPFQAPPTTLVSVETAAALGPPPTKALPGEERAYALAMIEALDNVIGEALQEISRERRARLTVMLMGDNGTADRVLHPSLDPSHAKGTLYELGIGVPLIVCGPTVAAPGTRDDSLVHVVDVVATIGELLGLQTVLGEDSVSFYDTFAQGLPGARETVFAERFNPNGKKPDDLFRTLVGPRYKLIRRTVKSAVTDELYDLALDPAEAVDLLVGQLTPPQQVAYDTLSAELEALLGSTASSFCDASDGSLASCPCANPGHPDTGCDIQQGTGGVRLDVTAQTTPPHNRATLAGTGYPPSSAPAVLVIRSRDLDPTGPVALGDGLVCLGLPVVRLGATFAVAGTSTHAFEHGAMFGAGTFYYQLWFRNLPSVFCDPTAAFNFSSGRSLTW